MATISKTILEIEEAMQEMQTTSMIEKPKVKQFLTSVLYECHLNCGRVIFREKLVKGGKDGSAAIIVPFTKDNRVLVIVEPRVFTKKGVGVGFPAGYIEPEEDELEGAKRELLEETGYQANDMIKLDSFYQDEGCSSAYNTIFLATNCEKVQEQHLDRDEIIKYFECTFEEVEELEKRGYIEGANSKLAIQKVKSLGGIRWE